VRATVRPSALSVSVDPQSPAHPRGVDGNRRRPSGHGRYDAETRPYPVVIHQ
jgi:hypothetical protein